MYKIHICDCGKPHVVEDVELFNLETKFKYVNCECGISQVNPFLLRPHTPEFYLDIGYSKYIDISEVEINPNKLILNKNYNPVFMLPCAESLYHTADRYILEDLMESINIIEFERGYKQNETMLYEIRQNNLHLGVIGLEIHFNKKTKVKTYWLSWTITVETFRSKGIGKAALNQLCEMLKEDGITELFVDSDENPQTIKFYENNNFEIISSSKEFRLNNPGVNKYFLMYDQDTIMKRIL